MLSRIVLLIFIFSIGCKTKETPVPIEYEGPLSEGKDVVVLYTENDRIKVKMVAQTTQEFKNGDREFPDGLYLEFYDEKGILTSTLKANNAFYFKEKDLWRGRGNVEVVNIEKKQQLNTEELFWKRDDKKIYTEKFVTIKLASEVIYGTGLDAAQDLSTYVIKKVEGEFDVKD
jgi:LPS export ABC transporter protein LptC